MKFTRPAHSELVYYFLIITLALTSHMGIKVNPERAFSGKNALKTAHTIWKNAGLQGLWRGNPIMVVRTMPHAGIQFLCYDEY